MMQSRRFFVSLMQWEIFDDCKRYEKIIVKKGNG